MKKLLLALTAMLFVNGSSISAFPGYVSRDCGAAATRESITVDWKSNERLFYTESFHLVTEGNNKVQKYYQSYPCNGPGPCYLWGWRSYAGTTSLQNVISHQGVTGYHYWKRGSKDDWRTSYTTNCSVESWGYDNWDY